MNIIVSVPLNEELASLIGKKGSVNGTTFYNRKIGEDVIVALAPTNAAEKPYGIAESMLVSDLIIISTADIGKEFGEALVAASLLDKKVLLTDENDVSKFLSTGLLKDYEIVAKEQLIDKILAHKNASTNTTVRVDIDKAFPVTGIGTVVLGVVISGTVKVHDNLHHNSGKSISVRSMQSQDMDVKEAPPGTRVGIAVKGMEHDEIEKGDVFSSVKISNAKKLYASINMSKIANEKIAENMQYLVVSNFSHTDAKIKTGAEAEITLIKPLPLLPGDKIMLVRTQSPRIFASGTIKRVE